MRKLFPVSESCVYLDSAHYSQYSLLTKDKLNDFIHRFTYANFNLSVFNNEISERVRVKSAQLINADRDNMIITSCTSHGLNILANGLELKSGDKVAYADTEFPAVVYPWMNQARIKGIINVRIPSVNGKIKIKDIEKVLSENEIKVITISSVGFLGFRNDLGTVSGLCRKYGVILAVDAIQSAGIVPIDVKRLDIDFFATGGQKWMMSPAGAGFAYISPRLRNLVNPTYVSTTNVNYKFEKFLDYNLDLKPDGTAYENSTPNTLGMIGLESTLDLFMYIGIENIFIHITGLLGYFADKLYGNGNFYIESDLSEAHKSNILIFSHKDFMKNALIQKELEQKNIFIALREGFLRLSPHIFNNRGDIDTLISALNEF
ncbi:MAG: aminotransferase class V-fold PLP-dependent enzyme [Ignavibacteria bacterium]|nr:aminotransferase class V-fold PLP-dependent enzyme [Ignavibacteria bacterium]